jgi:predicted glycogen debranching enzyme
MFGRLHRDAEWLETDGLGGFASGTVAGHRTRRYHALLLSATTPPIGRVVLVNGIEAWIETAGKVTPISTQHYLPDVMHPRGDHILESFDSEPWPRWLYRLDDQIRIEQELFVVEGFAAVAMRWRLEQQHASSKEPVWLTIRPLISGRDYHSLHHENPSFRFDADIDGQRIAWRPYDGIPLIAAVSNGEYRQAPLWYRNFLYQREAERGLDCTEDLASPGEFRWNLAMGEAVWIASADKPGGGLPNSIQDALSLYGGLRGLEGVRRSKFAEPLDRAANAYIVQRGAGRTIVAGYPWFTDWGRDTFIALRGLCLATGRLDVARDILLAWSSVVSEGMLPNRFPDHGETPEYNSVDASLWYIVAVHEYLTSQLTHGAVPADADQRQLCAAICKILDGYTRGTRYRIHVDDDGLLAAGEPGLQLTWMDVKIGETVVTPRIGKPVELQALWLNALHAAQHWVPDEGNFASLFERGQQSFAARYWNSERGCLFDVVDVDHHAGRVDATIRPNQIFAVGGLPIPLLHGERARQVVDLVESHLWTPLGMRSLSPEDSAYRPRYEGSVPQRDSAYHQGTAWAWLLGPFVEAWLYVHGNTAQTRQAARGRFLQPLFDQLNDGGIGHVPEIADGDLPQAQRGCPFQAWSLGELLRLDRVVLSECPSRTALTSAEKCEVGATT